MREDVSPDFKGYNSTDVVIIKEILKHEGTPYAIIRFTQLSMKMSDYLYWFLLGTLWVSYSGWSDLDLWKQLFRCGRRKRRTSLMKPSEMDIWMKLPDKIVAYRAHRPGETDWISYTLSREVAGRFARERKTEVTEYTLSKEDCLAVFLRRDEEEIIMLDLRKARRAAI
jgi:hypothetical protein